MNLEKLSPTSTPNARRQQFTRSRTVSAVQSSSPALVADIVEHDDAHFIETICYRIENGRPSHRLTPADREALIDQDELDPSVLLRLAKTATHEDERIDIFQHPNIDDATLAVLAEHAPLDDILAHPDTKQLTLAAAAKRHTKLQDLRRILRHDNSSSLVLHAVGRSLHLHRSHEDFPNILTQMRRHPEVDDRAIAATAQFVNSRAEADLIIHHHSVAETLTMRALQKALPNEDLGSLAAEVQARQEQALRKIGGRGARRPRNPVFA